MGEAVGMITIVLTIPMVHARVNRPEEATQTSGATQG